jgi:hypothetical protein
MDTADPAHVAEMVGIAGGIQSKRVTQAREANWAAREHQIYYTNLIANLQKDYNRAQESGDEADKAAVNEEIRKTNEEILPEGFARHLGEYHRNYMNRERLQQRTEKGNIGPRRQWQELRERRQRAYPQLAPAQ